MLVGSGKGWNTDTCDNMNNTQIIMLTGESCHLFLSLMESDENLKIYKGSRFLIS